MEKYLELKNKLFENYLPILEECLFGNNPALTISDIEQSKSVLSNNLYFYKIIEIEYEKDYPQRKAFENIISSLNNSSFNFIYLLAGNPKSVSIYFGVVENLLSKNLNNVANAFDVSQSIVNSLYGNFLGSKVKRLTADEINAEIIKEINNSKRKSFIYGIPSINEQNSEEKNIFQGVDRLINCMRGETYQFILICQPVESKKVEELISACYSYYSQISRGSEIDFSKNESIGENDSYNEGVTDTKGKSEGTSTTQGKSLSHSEYSSTSTSKGTSNSISLSHSHNVSSSKGSNFSKGISLNIKIIEKNLKDQLEYLDKELIPRMKLGRAKGLYKTAVYAMSTDNVTLDKLVGNIKSIFQGDNSTFSPLKEVKLFDVNSTVDNNKEFYSNLISKFQICKTTVSSNYVSYLLKGLELIDNTCELATYLTAKEISLFGGFPLTEIVGVSLNEAVDFGININNNNDGFHLGNIIHRGNELIGNSVTINHKVLNKHIFISGVTGAGKTNTCQKILTESKLPFLVIEPAKTEYRQLYKLDNSIKYFTVGRNDLCPFRLNPMELVKGENLTSHIDILMATFQAIYPMEASIPFIVKEAIINCYEKLGWDLESNENEYTKDPWNEKGLYWPTFSNLVIELKNVVNSKGFAPELKSNYIGSIVSRFHNLTIGTRGSIFDVPCSIEFDKILEENVVLEFDEIKNEEDKILLMGLVLTRISEVVKRKYKQNKNFQHITLIEEAHRLLTKPEVGENSKRLAVQTFTDMLAEVRKYGESLIIVDQIPAKLVPDVIKNTNTKIIHKIFAEDDKTEIAHAIALDDKQKEFLSKLNVGEAIVYTEGWHKPIWMKISNISNKITGEISEKNIAEIGLNLIIAEKQIFFPNFGNYNLNGKQVEFLLKKKNSLINKLMRLIKIKLSEEELSKIKLILKHFAEQFQIDEKLLKSIANDIWTSLKIHYHEYNLIEENKRFVIYISSFLNQCYYDKINYDETSDEFKFINKIKDKIK